MASENASSALTETETVTKPGRLQNKEDDYYLSEDSEEETEASQKE